MKVPKSQVNYKIQIDTEYSPKSPSPGNSPNRYRGTSRLYQLNLSKMLLKCPDAMSPFAPYRHKDNLLENPEQLLVVSSAFNSTKAGNEKNNQKSNSLYSSVPKKNKLAHQRKNLAKKLQQIAADLIRKQNESQQRMKKQKQQFEDKEGISASITLANRIELLRMQEESQLLISQKKIHEQPVNQHTVQKSNFEEQRVKNVKRHSLNPINRSSKGIQLPQLRHRKTKLEQNTKTAPAYLKTTKKVSSTQLGSITLSASLNSNVPILMKDPEDLRIVKSQSYAVVEYPSKNLILSSKGQLNLQIASLTKIMTFYTVRKITEEFNLDISIEKVIITDQAMDMSGTSAEILAGEVYTIEELLHGLMLPSGNDAATALAQWGGQFILTNLYETLQKFPALSLSLLQSKDGTKNERQLDQKISSKEKLKAFICLMNLNAKNLNLGSTKFANPHGLPHPENKSSAIDVGKLCASCLQDPVFIKVSSTQKYKCSVSNFIEANKLRIVRYKVYSQLQENEINLLKDSQLQKKYNRIVEWENTNKLLRRENFVGIKTGITVTAGPCLATGYKFRDKIYVTVLLRALKVSRRFKETRKILVWCIEKLYRNELTEEEKKTLNQLKRNRPQFDSDYSEDEHEFNYDIVSTAEYKKRSNFINYEM